MNEQNNKKEDLIAIYAIASQTADTISTNRVTTNGWMSAIIPIILVAVFSADFISDLGKVLLIFFNIILSVIWMINIRYYKMLNSAKFKAIAELEEKLEFKFYEREYFYLKGKKKKTSYFKSGARIDQSMAIIFIVMNVIVLLLFICSIIKPFIGL